MSKKRVLPEFRPPQPNRAIIWLSEHLLPLYVRLVERLSFEFSESPGQPLEGVKGKPVAIVVNHGDRQDPLVVVALAKYMREPVYCVVAREVFDWYHGMLGWLFQKLGCYSVNRGIADFESIHTTEKILTRFDRKLVVFPEAEITGDEQSVHELNRPFTHILLKAQEELSQSDSAQSIWVLPVGVSYRLETDLESSVNKTLTKIERHLGISHASGDDAGVRTTAAVDAVLKNISEHYKCALPKDQPRHEQVRVMARHILETIGKYAGVQHRHDFSNEQLLYSLRNDILEVLCAGQKSNPYQQSLWHANTKIYGEFLHDFDRVERLLIVHRVLMRAPSPIQVCRILDFLEAENCGRMTKKGRQSASVYIGKPIEILPYLEPYKSDKSSTIASLSACIRSQLQSAFESSHREQVVDGSTAANVSSKLQ